MGPSCFRQCLHFKNNTPVKICEGTEKRSAVLHLVTFITISRSSPSFCVGAAIFGGGHTFLWLSMIERTKGRIKLLQDIRYLLSLQLLHWRVYNQHFTWWWQMGSIIKRAEQFEFVFLCSIKWNITSRCYFACPLILCVSLIQRACYCLVRLWATWKLDSLNRKIYNAFIIKAIYHPWGDSKLYDVFH